MANSVRFGLSHVHYAVWDEKTSTYGTPKPIPGAVSLSLSREGDTSSFFADDVPFFSTATNAGYSGTLEIAAIPDSVLIDLLKYEQNGNILVENSNVTTPTFALMYQVQGNIEPQRFVFYNCSLSRPEQEANTKTDTTEPDTQSLDITMITRDFNIGTEENPVTMTAVKAHITKTDENEAAYNAFFNTVTIPQHQA